MISAPHPCRRGKGWHLYAYTRVIATSALRAAAAAPSMPFVGGLLGIDHRRVNLFRYSTGWREPRRQVGALRRGGCSQQQGM